MNKKSAPHYNPKVGACVYLYTDMCYFDLWVGQAATLEGLFKVSVGGIRAGNQHDVTARCLELVSVHVRVQTHAGKH